MKIIGKTDCGFIVECNEETLKNIIGKRYHERHDFRIGDKINVCQTWRKLNDILSLHNEFERTCKTLSALHDLLENVGGGLMQAIEAEEHVE